MQNTTRRSGQPQAASGDNIVKGASRGFTVLLLGGAVQPLVGTALPAVGYPWLALIAVAAFAWSASIATRGGAPAAHGVFAALGAYALVLPVVVMGGALDLMQVGYTTALALIVGFVVAAVNKAESVQARADAR